jgi:cytochrome c peroxidase
MRKALWSLSLSRPVLALGTALVLPAGCAGLGDDVDGFSSEEWDVVRDIQPLHTDMPRNAFNTRDRDWDVAELGQRLFYETEMAEAITVNGPSGKMGEVGKVGCINCHDPKRYYIDSRPDATVSHGRTFTGRHSPVMLNNGYYEWVGWVGRHDSLVMHGTGVMGTAATPLAIAKWLFTTKLGAPNPDGTVTPYKDIWNEVFPMAKLPDELGDPARFPGTGTPDPAKMSAEDVNTILQMQANLGRIWDTYPRKLNTPGSPFERYVDGEKDAITPAAKRGLALFVGKAACNDCHNGPILSDSQFHNLGVPMRTGASAPDQGRLPDVKLTLMHAFNGASKWSDNPDEGRKKHAGLNVDDQSLVGTFRTPTLLNVAETAPYFHTGEFKTLEDVVRFYNQGGGTLIVNSMNVPNFVGQKSPRLKPLGLTEDEIADIVAFLKTLTGPIPEEWQKDIRQEPWGVHRR